MAEYWQDKRVNPGHVVCAWALVLVMLVGMAAVTFVMAPACGPKGEAGICADADTRAATMQRRP